MTPPFANIRAVDFFFSNTMPQVEKILRRSVTSLACFHHATASVLFVLMLHFASQRVSANSADLEHFGVKLQSIISKYHKNNGLCALDY